MTILKLPKEGDAHTGHVTECSVAKGNYGEQVKFRFANGDELYIGKATADRQLMRCGFDGGEEPDYAAVAGNTLHFSRDHNPKAPDKPYWGISIATAADTKPPSKRVAGPSSVPGEAPERHRAVFSTQSLGVGQAEPRTVHTGGVTLDDIASAYAWAWGHSAKTQDETDPGSVQAGAATLLIALQKEGLTRGFAQRSFDTAVRDTLDLPPADGDDLPFSGGDDR